MTIGQMQQQMQSLTAHRIELAFGENNRNSLVSFAGYYKMHYRPFLQELKQYPEFVAKASFLREDLDALLLPYLESYYEN